MKRLLLPILFAAALTAADSSVVPGMNTFTVDAYKQLAPGGANLILSPFNIATVLSMALAGARGRTASEIESVLHARSDSKHDAALAALLADLAKAGNSGDNQLLTANGLWVQQGFAIEAPFESTLASNYNAPPVLLDFATSPEAARSRINAWAEEHTKAKIQNLLPPGSINAATRLVLTGAIYFYGAWQDPFTAARTQPAPFTLRPGATTQADFMNQVSHFGYSETASAQILEMRYAGTGIAFDVLLPKSAAGLAELEDSLTAENLAGWLAGLSKREVELSLPKFRAESQFSLGKALSSLGMPTAFGVKADFSGIAPNQGLYISEVIHKAFVDVSEKGTEAAAATGTVMMAMARMAQRPVVFRADHPFLFLIRDTSSQAILFIGRLMNPGKA